MKNVNACIVRVVFVVLTVLCMNSARGGFALDFNDSSIRQVSPGFYEIDGNVSLFPNDKPSTQLQSLLMSFKLEAQNGTDSIEGISFVGLRNPDAPNRLFTSPLQETGVLPGVPHELFPSLINSAPVSPPPVAPGTLAFTIGLYSSNPNTINVKISFGQFNEYETKRVAGEPNNFSLEYLRDSSGPLSITGVPEPGTYLLTSLGLGAVGLMRKRSKLRAKRTL